MNFITKNLGWILLLLFFVFMLFIISSNNPQWENNSVTWSVSTWSTASWELDQNIDDLMKLINDDNSLQSESEAASWIQWEVEIETESWSLDADVNENIEEEANDSEEKWFFARLFWRDETDDNDQSSTQSGSTLSWILINDNQENNQDSDVVDENELISDMSTNLGAQVWKNANIVKSNSAWSSKMYIDRQIVYPGLNLETAIWNTYEIWVTALKLNNKSFNQTLWYMKKWQKVTQLTSENSYGCFQVEVLSTWKKWYVCKKYLEKSSQWNVQEELDNSTDYSAEIQTAVGSYYKVEQWFESEKVDTQSTSLTKEDILRQETLATDSKPCVDMKIVGSNVYENTWKIVRICNLNNIAAY